MNSYTVVNESRRIRKEAYDALKECYKNPNNKELVQIKLNLCDIFLTVIRHMLKNECTNGPQKVSSFYTLNHLSSIKESLFTLINVTGGTVNPFVKWLDLEEVFNGCIKVGMIKNFGFLDIDDFLTASRDIFCEKVNEVHKTVKVYVKLDALFSLTKVDRIIEDNKSFISNVFPIFRYSDVTSLYNEKVLEILKKTIEEFQETDSGWTLKKINFLTVHIHKYNPLRAGTYIELPEFLKKKRACINVQNDDQYCFKWTIIVGLMHQDMEKQPKNSVAVKNIRNPYRVSVCKKRENEFKLDFSGISFPVDPTEIKIFEKKNNISINLYSVHEDENGEQRVCVVQPSSIKKTEKHMNLLLLQDVDDSEEVTACEDTFRDVEKNITKKRKVTVLRNKYRYHYVYIKNLSRLVSSQMSKNHMKKHFCDICFHYFPSEIALMKHEKKCLETNDCEIILPDPEDEEQRVVKFKNFHHKLTVPFVIYSDFESVLKPIQDDERKETKHEPVSIGYYLKCR